MGEDIISINKKKKAFQTWQQLCDLNFIRYYYTSTIKKYVLVLRNFCDVIYFKTTVFKTTIEDNTGSFYFFQLLQ